MIQLPGIEIIEKIYEGGKNVIYKALKNQKKIIIKTSKYIYPKLGEVKRLVREYEILSRFRSEGIVRPLELIDFQNRPFLVMEDIDGVSLDQLILQQNLQIGFFLDLALKTVNAVSEIHKNHIIHKDIKPHNIIYNMQTGELQIIDFENASLFEEELSESNEEFFEGSMAYMSPEQSGRMNRSADYRSDYYSLGVTFYQLLTSELPFRTDDAMKIFHAHLAQKPESPKEKNQTPVIISDIIMKLMEKTPESRYQSSYGILKDLLKCRQAMDAMIPEDFKNFGFPLAQYDGFSEFKIPKKLYGRKKEIENLLNAFSQVRLQGGKHLTLISGYSGVGKSALTMELQKPVTSSGGYFLTGKFDQLNSNKPFYAVIQVFSKLITQLLGENSENSSLWRERIVFALGRNGKLLTDLIPELEIIIGKQPDVSASSSLENANRFNLLFINFLKVFTQKENPITVFLDDMQWADRSSLNLLLNILQEPSLNWFCLILAYRKNEVSDSHPFYKMVQKLNLTESQILKIDLLPLAPENISQMLSDAFHLSPGEAEPLAELLCSKTEGNPFFLRETLIKLHKEKLIIFDADRGKWACNIADIRNIQFAENVIDLLVRKIAGFPEETVSILRLASCIGNRFDVRTLGIISGLDNKQVLKLLLPAVQEDLIFSSQNPQQIYFQFQHDKVQQACFEQMNPSECAYIRLKIGKLLLNSVSSEDMYERIFEITEHLNAGSYLIGDENEKISLIEMNLAAAEKAKQSAAYSSSLLYLRKAGELFYPGLWERKFSLSYRLYKELAEAEHLNGNFENSVELVEYAEQNCANSTDKGNLLNLLITIYSVQGKFDKAYQIIIKILSMFSIQIEGKNSGEIFQEEVREIRSVIGDRSFSSLDSLPLIKDPEQELIARTLANATAASYQYATHLFPLLGAKLVNLYLKYGNMQDSYGYALFGIMLNVYFADYKQAYECFELTYRLSEKYNNVSAKAKAANLLANYGSPFLKPLKDSGRINRECIEAGLESGEFEHGGYGIGNDLVNSFFQGMYLGEIRLKISELKSLAEKFKHFIALDIISGVELVLSFLNGNRENDEYKTEEKFLSSFQSDKGKYPLAMYGIMKEYSNFIMDRPERCIREASEKDELLQYLTGTYLAVEHAFIQTVSLTSLYETFSVEEKGKASAKISENADLLRNWSETCPENFNHQYLLVLAETSRIKGDFWNALNYYDSAASSANKNGFFQNEALANELAGKMFLLQNKTEFAYTYLIKSYHIYETWGAVNKCEALRRAYPNVFQQKENPQSPYININDLSSFNRTLRYISSRLNEKLDLQTVIRTSHILSEEIDFDRLIVKIMQSLIENSGADRGAFITVEKSRTDGIEFLFLEADCRAEGSGLNILRKRETDESNLPLSVINNVYRTGKMIVLENAALSGDFINDPYIQKQNSKSILCFPVENRNRLLGIIYLENSLAAYVFSESRVEILNILSLQIAISLQNAKFITDIEEARKKAEEANAVKSDFLANMSHEIKTPMNGILGMKSLLEMTDLNLEQKEYLRVIGICSESLLIIINDILNISKLESGSISLEELPFDLSRSAADTVQIVQNEIRQKKLYLDFHIDNDVPQFIIGDESRLRQILLNLLNNAVKFTNTGGIDFSIRLRGRAENRAYIEFSVKDTGIGIEEEKLSKIFDPFTQADSSISRKFGGTGLGLAISRKLAELLGGSITAESAFGKGSNFILSLNAEEYQISDKSRTENPEVDFREPKQNDFPSILLIEENIIDKNLIIKLLKNIGYRIKNSVLNSAEAEKVLRFGNYDLILMDMEKNDAGADALRSFQEIFHEKNSPVIIGFVNGINEEVKNMYVKAGVSDFISKPIDINEMKHKILYWTSSIKKQ